MTFDVEVGGRTVRVALTRTPTGWDVTVDGQPRQVDATQVGGWMSLLVGEDERNGTTPGQPASSHEIAFDDRGRGELVVHVNGTPVPLSIADPRAAWSRRGREHGSAGEGPKPIVAPMPGRVVKVLVKPGDAVAARQGLVVVEAMKMENELRSPKDGAVVDVRVGEGMSVEAGTVLIVVE